MHWKNEFTLDPEFTYMNCGTMSITPNFVLRAVNAYRNEYEKNPAHGLLSAWERLAKLQMELAAYFRANHEDLYFRTNVTYAMNDFLLALKLPENSEILVSSLEYGAIVNICRHKANLEGHSLKVLPIVLAGISEEKILEDFSKAISRSTKIAVFSHVATGSGLVFPIEKMAEIAHSKGVFFIVDGAHGAGSLPLDFGCTSVDFYGTNMHKWMLGPKGTSFAWVNPRVREFLEPKFAGWTSYDVQPIFRVFSDPWTCRWMISSTHNFADFYAIKETIEFWKTRGQGNIFARQRELKKYAATVVSEKTGWDHYSNYGESLEGPMIAFRLPEKIEKLGFNLMFTLKENRKLQVSMVQLEGKWCMRLAPHIYNDESDIDRAAEILASL